MGDDDVVAIDSVGRYEADESSDDELVGEYTHVTMQVCGEGIARGY